MKLFKVNLNKAFMRLFDFCFVKIFEIKLLLSLQNLPRINQKFTINHLFILTLNNFNEKKSFFSFCTH